MELPRYIVRLLAGAMAAALAGVLALQYTLLRDAVRLREESFGRNALAALAAAADRAEEIDVRDRFFLAAGDTSGPVVRRFRPRPPGAPEPGHSVDSMVFVSVVTGGGGTLSAQVRGDRLSYAIDGPRKVTVRLFDELGRLDTTILDAVRAEGAHWLPLPEGRLDSGVAYLQITADSASSTLRLDRSAGNVYRFETGAGEHAGKIIRRVAESVTAFASAPLAERVRAGLLDTLLARALEENGITIPFRFAVRDPATDSLVLSRMEPGERVPDDALAAVLFPGGMGGAPGRLHLWFPGYGGFMLRSILPELLLTVLFVLVIAGCFVWALGTLRRQREFAGRVTEFINNMTHEFKTPLSTIALSTEALARAEVGADRAQVEMYGGIITEEQRRMKTQVDRILGMAALEEGEAAFRTERVDLHAIVSRAAAGCALRVRARGGQVSTDLRAPNAVVSGDPVHLENAVNSVLENAEKYSPDAPSIAVSTREAGGRIVLTVRDRGIGIAAEHLPHIFEKYYRVPTNNVHDVKGFGLGLSYVKLVVERHGGAVRAQSAPGEGVAIEMSFRAGDGR